MNNFHFSKEPPNQHIPPYALLNPLNKNPFNRNINHP